ncbi:glycerophosphodiester phosphodiesterase [Prosthecomicrobium sp. N25]|uniref:glycerophosphodiester phosphodiesterase n=1 Tax=Prosthecomicrobium sp. N25 TaxID=3129254 RepID=UPI0030780B3F
MTGPLPRLKWHMLRRRKTEPAHQRDSLRAALEAGAACEVDVVLTRDGHALCLHDRTLDRETSGTGPVAAAARADIERLRQRGPDGRLLDSPPLFLDEVVAAVAAHGRPDGGLVQLDVKEPAFRLDAAARRAIGAVLGDLAPRFVAGGAEWEAIEDLAEAAPGLRKGFDPLAFYTRRLPADPAWFEALGTFTLRTAPDAAIFYLEARLVLAGLDAGVNLVDRVGRAGAEVDAWTVDADRPDLLAVLRRLIGAGCRQITTNDPLALAPLIEEFHPCS